MSTIKVDTLQTRAGNVAAVTGAGFVATDQIKGNTTATTVTLPTTTNIGATAIVSGSAGSATIIAEGGTVVTNIQQGLTKAFARFSATAFTESFNFSSFTDNGTGDFTLTFTNDMANDKYVNAWGSEGGSDVYRYMWETSTATTGPRIREYYFSNAVALTAGDLGDNADTISGDLA